MLSNAHYLKNSGVELDGLRFWGSPITPVMESMGGSASRKVWDRIPDGTDVLITHGPPQSILDQEHILGEHLGCTALLQAVLRVRPQVHVFGHTHGGHGEETGRHGTQFVNCSVVNAQRRLAHAATVVEAESGNARY